ncbi:Pycsar system effector family protein [Neisseria zalophi]|uniref:Pycsar system effector family protein n=1 Tax=Neisseria zalophi TaxID=640030 RepID=UPI00177D2B65
MNEDKNNNPKIVDNSLKNNENSQKEDLDGSSSLLDKEPLLLLENLEETEVLPDEVFCEESMAGANIRNLKEKKSKKKAGKEKIGGKSKKAKSNIQPPEPILQMGTAKGVETMFRNAFRTEMELLALAATKANIMISLNGFIVSALMISGAFIFSSSPEFLVPAGIFMATGAASIVFALFSASPDRIGKINAALNWWKDLLKGKAKWRHFKTRVLSPRVHFFDEKPNILIYEDRVKIPKQRYWEMMQEIMSDREQVYHKMSDELYWLGLLANKQFKYLNISYAIFRWGLLASVLAFIGMKTLPSISSDAEARKNAAKLRGEGIYTFSSVYEPSAVQQIPDGRLLVVEDEADRAASILAFNADGTLVENDVADTRIIRGLKRKLSDLEGLTRDNEGYIYAATSHSRNREGLRRPDREHLLRFKIQGNDVVELSSFNSLVDTLENSEELAAMLKEKTGTTLDFKSTNIEGLAYDPRSNNLLLGFRDPEFNEKSMIIYIDNPKAVFESKEQPHFSNVVFLDIKGGGIRSLNYDPVLKAFIMTNEVKDEDGSKFSQFWTWNGDPEAAPKAVDLPNLRHLTNVEAVDSIKINGQPRLIFMSDEGDVDKKLTAKYMIVDYKDF